jgi:hypothetical protein
MYVCKEERRVSRYAGKQGGWNEWMNEWDATGKGVEGG